MKQLVKQKKVDQNLAIKENLTKKIMKMIHKLKTHIIESTLEEKNSIISR